MASDQPLPGALAQPAGGSIYNEITLATKPLRPRRRWWRWWRILRVALIAFLLVVLLCVLAGAAAYENPALLLPVGNLLFGSQKGVVAWNGSDPLNILVMGIDQRTTEPTRTDTMIVLHVDPASHDITMLSVPRDLWVDIPAPGDVYGYAKINSAYVQGQIYGKGPQFAVLTVESVLHIPINYYAVFKFSGFKSLVDAMGGVTVCVPHELYDAQYPNDTGYGWHTIDIKAGCQHMDGTVALEYARERHADAEQDLGRIEQQQAIMTGIEKGLFSPLTLFHLPAIISAVDNAVITDLPHAALLQLGMLLGRATGSHTRHAYINVDGGYVTSTTASDGEAILQPDWPQINALVTSLFPNARLHSENATVQVLNGQHTVGLAALYTTILQGMGFNTVAAADADTNTYAHTLLIVNSDRPAVTYTTRLLAQMMQADVVSRSLGAAHPQITIVLGADAAEGS